MTGSPLDPARVGAGSLAAAAAELIGPLAPAATPRPLDLQPGAPKQAQAVVDTVTRYPLVLVTLLTDLDDQELTVTPGTAPALTFAPYSAAGSALVAVVPPVDAGGTATPFTVTISARRAGVSLDFPELTGAVRVDLVQGVLGRLLTVLLDEKSRIRRTARQLRTLRALATAGGDALDRIGVDLSCPRFADELFWDATRQSPGTRPLQPPGTLEDDASYRARLRVLRGVRLPSPPWIDSVVNGFLADVGVTGRAVIDEVVNPQQFALRLIAPGDPEAVPDLLDAIRRVQLIWPADSPTGDTLHEQRLLPPAIAKRVSAQRAALATWQLPDGQPVAPALAAALTTLDDRCVRLGARPWPRLLAGQSDDGGSRFELGLGARLAAPVAAQLDAAVAAATALHDPALVPRPRSEDPAGAWLLNACGLRTAERDSDGTVFVSTVLMGPLVLDVDPDPGHDVPLTLTARLVSAADPDHDVPMVAVIQALAAAALTPVAAPATVLAGARPVTSVPGLAEALTSRALPGVTAVAAFAQQLGATSGRDYAIFDLGAARTATVIATPTALSPILAAAVAGGASSVVGLATAAGTLALMFGVAGLPLAGSNLSARHTLIHRWQVRALRSLTPAQVRPRRGSRVTVAFPGQGVSVVSCLVSQHTGANEPYEWRPALPDGALLSLRQYEHLLNIVELVTPVGVRADTFAIRRQHVDVDGSGRATGLSPAAARSYRHYRLARSARAGQGES
ncbi:hypothetical protein [Actinophytocola sp.]|uniref:hypothetical protein n=1 Tax=Actinophytocola sp. TaxID=1872138 RepID=UPI002D80E16B|nr:hypothetical protein [Actinophytocola sp.]HET9141628.1 hypothetical protein [Actinophytocola sp.]